MGPLGNPSHQALALKGRACRDHVWSWVRAAGGSAGGLPEPMELKARPGSPDAYPRPPPGAPAQFLSVGEQRLGKAWPEGPWAFAPWHVLRGSRHSPQQTPAPGGAALRAGGSCSWQGSFLGGGLTWGGPCPQKG